MKWPTAICVEIPDPSDGLGDCAAEWWRCQSIYGVRTSGDREIRLATATELDRIGKTVPSVLHAFEPYRLLSFR